MHIHLTLLASFGLINYVLSAPAASTPLPKPKNGATWHIQIEAKIDTTKNHNAQVYDIDLFENDAADVAKLHSMGKYVICYFSAGTLEHKRPDASNFSAATPGHQYSDPNGLDKEETWFNTKEDAVRKPMAWRIQRAATIGCDAIDPDNVDTYDNDTGFNTGDVKTDQATSVDYLQYLHTTASNLGLGMGLKNSGDIVGQVIDIVDFQVNENCANNTECSTFRIFIDKSKPVFEIEYPDYLQTDGAPINRADWTRLCGDTQEPASTKRNQGFSVALKNFGLGDFVDPCGASPVTPPAIVNPGN